MKIAALDLGSNTSLLLIAEVEGGKVTKVYHDESRVTRMGQGVHADRRLHPEALERLDACFAEFQKTIRQHGADRVIAVATSAARDVKNGEALIELGRKYEIPIYIISGEQEARLTFRGALCDRDLHEGVAVVDVGGGSTETISLVNGQERGVSVDVGSVRLTEMFITKHPVPASELTRVREYVSKEFAAAQLPKQNIRELVAVAGTPTTLAALNEAKDFDENFVHSYHLTREHLRRWIEKLAALSVEERESLPGMQPKRADVIVAGATILDCAAEALGQNQMTVSTLGVRYGVALAWQDFR